MARRSTNNPGSQGFHPEPKRDRATIRRAASHAIEGLERRCLLTGSATDLTTAQSAVLAAVPHGLHGQLIGSKLVMSAAAIAGVATPNYALVDANPALSPAGQLAPFSTTGPSGMTPAQMRHAYGVDNIQFGSVTGDGTGQTIAIIDAYDYPTAAADLHAFDLQFNLPDPPSFTKVNQTGGSTLPGTDPSAKGSDWELEEALDIEWTHAMAPGASVVLVEANSPTDADLINAAVGWARSAPAVSAVSMSFGRSESSSDSSLAPVFTTPPGHAGVTFLASTGDGGAPGGFPAYSPNVVAVGGTTLNTDSSGNILSETAWSGSGGGISAYEAQPAYQQGVVTQTSTNRAIPDVALDADPYTGAAVYDSYDYGTSAPWQQVGGTSLSSPAWAGLIAIANQGRAVNGGTALDGPTQTLPRLYSAPASDFHDITSGSNGFAAGLGYDLVTGRGTPIADALVPYLSAAGPSVTSFAPAGIQSAAPSAVTFTFSTPMDPSSFSVATGVDAFTGPGGSDLTSSITGFSWQNGNTTLEVDFVAPSTQGPYTMTIGPQILSAGGVAMDQNQNGVNGESPADEYAGTFYYDVSPTSVASTTPPVGATITPPFTTLDVHFTAAIDPATVGVDDLTLSQGTVTAATVLDAMTAEYTLSSVTRGGTVSISMPQGAVMDANENPVLAFNGNYVIPTPPAPGTPALLAATDSGVSNSDDITNFDNSSAAKALQFAVPNTIAGDIVSIYADGNLIGSATATSTTTPVTTNGTAPLSNGTHSITARQGPAGGQSGDSAPLFVTILNAPLTLPSAGGYDRTFNGAGFNVTTGLTGWGAESVVAQADGTTLAGGAATQFGQGATSAVLARYTATGQLDPTFGNRGYVFANTPGGSAGDQTARSIAVQSDGKIVVLVTPADNTLDSQLYVARFNADGTPDATFGSGGVATIFPGSTVAAGTISVQSDGKLVVAAATTTEHGILVRLTPTGKLDTTFNGLGYVTSNFGGYTYFVAAALTADGHIVTVGHMSAGGNFNVVVARYTATGLIDTTFGGGGTGYVMTPVGAYWSNSKAVALQPDGKIVVSAYAGPGVALLRYSAGGVLDPTFGTGGIATLPGSDPSNPALQADGKIVLGGLYNNAGGSRSGFVYRVNADGSWDNSFGTKGQVITTIGPAADFNFFLAMAVQADGRIVAAGEAGDPANPGARDLTLARFFGATPTISLDPASDSGISNTDRITDSTAPVFDIPNLPGLYTRIYRSGTLVSALYATGGTATLGPQPQGVDSYAFALVDPAGNQSPLSSAYTVTFDTVPPSAGAPVGPGLSSTAPSYTFSVTYTDSFGVAGTSLGNGNILVTSPGGYSQPATLLGASPTGNPNSVTATYQITPPSGGWGAAGTSFTFTLQGNSVTDVAGNAVPSSVLGSVSVIAINPPGAPVLQPATDSGVSNSDGITNFDNSSAAKALQFVVTNTTAGATVTVYADGVAIGTAIAPGTSANTPVTTNGAYALTNGVHAITARQTLSGAQTADSAALSITVDTAPPAAAIGGPLVTSSANYNFTVTYSDANGVDVSTLDGNDLRVTSAAGYNQLATLVSISPASNGSPIVATYQITPPAGGWSAGSPTYSVSVQSAQVADVAGNFIAGATIGTLSVTPAAAPGKPTLAAATDSGVSASDGITNFDNSSPAKALQFVVAAISGDAVTIYADGIAVGSGIARSGTVTVTTDGATPLASGAHTITARQTPPGGLRSADSVPLTITIETAAIVPSAPRLDRASDSGVSNSDGITNVLGPTVDVTAAEAGTLYLQIDGPNGPTLSQAASGPGVVQIPAVAPGGFQSPLSLSSNLSAGNGNNDVAAGDFNGDGKQDFVVLGSSAQLFLGKGDGTFAPPITIPNTSGAYEVLPADFNGDGKPDLWFRYGSAFQVLLGNGDGTFRALPRVSGNIAFSTHFADMNGDGKLDMIAMNGSGSSTFGVWLGNGDGTFRSPTLVNAGITVNGLTVGDVNGDGRPDVVLDYSYTTSSLAVVLNMGNNTFAAPVITPLTGFGVDALLSGDFNGDGKSDVFIADADSTDQVLLSNGNGTFQAPLKVTSSSNPGFAVVGDFNHDGKLDAAVGANNVLYVYYGKGNGTFQPANTYSFTSGFSGIAADFNGDGNTDIATSNLLTSNNVSVFLATGGPVGAGTHTLTAWETDLAGNVSGKASSTITIDTTPPTVQMAATQTGSTPVDAVTLTFSEPVAGLSPANLQLTLNGSVVALTSSQTLRTYDGITWTLSGLTPLTSAAGAYQLTLASSPTVTDIAGNALANGGTTNWTQTVVTAGGTASFVRSDTSTQGTWPGVYGGDGYAIFGGATNLPAYAGLSISSASEWTWAANTSDPRAMQAGPGSASRLAACDTAGSSFTLDLNLTDGKTHQVALYGLHWDSWSYRNETVTLSDANTGAALDARNLANFGNGQWLVWNLSGHVKITVTNAGGVNAVLSGIMFDPPTTGAPGATASFVKNDSATQGTWAGFYGADGYSIVNGATNLPAYAQLTASGAQAWTWQQPSDGDPRTLLTAAGSTGRLAACDYSATSFGFDLNLGDGKTHQVALYALNWDSWSYRAETIQVHDAATGAVLDSRDVTNFGNGQWLVWNLSGHVRINVINDAGVNAVISGLFFDPPPGTTGTIAAASFLGADATTQGTWTGTYGGDGYNVFNGGSNLPSYATLSVPSNVPNYTWAAGTPEARALQTGPGSTNRIAACDYSDAPGFALDLNLTDGKSHRVALYFLDYDAQGRAETITISDAASGTVLDTQSASNFTQGKYLAWSLSGHVKITISNAGGLNEVVSGIFFA